MWRKGLRTLVLALAVAGAVVAPAAVAAEKPPEPGVSSGILTPDYPYLAPDVSVFHQQAARVLSGQMSLIAQGVDVSRGAAGTSEDAASPGGPQRSVAGAPSTQGGVLVPYRDPSARFSRNILIPTDFSTAPLQTEPHLATDPDDPDHVIAGMIDYNFPGVTTYVTYDGGVTWEGPSVIKRPREELGAGGDPVVAFDQQGSAYVAFISLDTEEFTVGNIIGAATVSSMALSVSTDGGFKWSEGAPAVRSQVTSDFTEDAVGRTRGTVSLSFLDKPWLAIGPNPDDVSTDIIYITYTNFATTYQIFYTDELPFLSSPVLETVIEMVKSEDGGITWSEPLAVSPRIRQIFEAGRQGEPDSHGNAAAPAVESPDTAPGGQVITSRRRIVQGSYLDVDPEGALYVSWMDSTDDGPFEGLAQIYVSRSADGGDSFTAGRRATRFLELGYTPRSTFFRFWGSSFSRIALGNDGEIYVVYSGAPSGTPTDDADVYLVRSLDLGRSWSSPLRINDDRTSGMQFFPAMDVSPNGNVHVMWGDTRDDPEIDLRYHIYYAMSEDQGVSFGVNSRVTDSSSNPNYGFPGGQFIGDYFGLSATDEDVYLVWADTRLGEFQGTNQKIGFARQRQMPNPSVFLSPARGASATPVTIQGFNYQADQDIFILVSGVLVAQQETNSEGRFTTQLFFPIAGEGAQTIAVLDASGNSATASFYNEFGFDNIAQTSQDILDIKAAIDPAAIAAIQDALERIENAGVTSGNGTGGEGGNGNGSSFGTWLGVIFAIIVAVVSIMAVTRWNSNDPRSDEGTGARHA